MMRWSILWALLPGLLVGCQPSADAAKGGQATENNSPADDTDDDDEDDSLEDGGVRSDGGKRRDASSDGASDAEIEQGTDGGTHNTPDGGTDGSINPGDGGGTGCAAGRQDCNGDPSDGCESRAGECDPVVVATGQDTPYGVAVYGDSVYWTNSVSNGGIMRAPRLGRPGSGVESVALPERSAKPIAIAADASGIYWTEMFLSGRVRKLEHGQATPTTLVDSSSSIGESRALALTASSVFFTLPLRSTVYVVSKSGGRPNIVLDQQSSVDAIVTHGSNIYWTTYGQLSRSSIARPATAERIVPEPCTGCEVRFQGLAVDDRYAFWVDVGRGFFGRVDLTTLAETRLYTFPGDAAFTNAWVSDSGDSVYWLRDRTSDGEAARATIYKTNKRTGATEVLVGGLNTPSRVVADGGWIYWTETGAGRVMKLRVN